MWSLVNFWPERIIDEENVSYKSTTLQTATPYKPLPCKTRRVNPCLPTKQIFKNPIPYQLQPFFL
jgi:hypothetical protein